MWVERHRWPCHFAGKAACVSHKVLVGRFTTQELTYVSIHTKFKGNPLSSCNPARVVFTPTHLECAWTPTWSEGVGIWRNRCTHQQSVRMSMPMLSHMTAGSMVFLFFFFLNHWSVLYNTSLAQPTQHRSLLCYFQLIRIKIYGSDKKKIMMWDSPSAESAEG